MSERWVTVRSFLTAIDAHLAKGKLESESISSQIMDENIVSINWLYSLAVGGVKLQVKPEDLDRARKILAEDAMEPSEELFSDPHCPCCGAPGNFLAVRASGFTVCARCEYRWRA